MTERVLRSETDMLKKQELIRVKSTGMEITNEGTEVLSQLNDYFNVYSDDNKMARAIRDKFHIKDVHVIQEIQILIKQLKEKWGDKLVS